MAKELRGARLERGKGRRDEARFEPSGALSDRGDVERDGVDDAPSTAHARARGKRPSVTPSRENGRTCLGVGFRELTHQECRLGHREAAPDRDAGDVRLVATWQRGDLHR